MMFSLKNVTEGRSASSLLMFWQDPKICNCQTFTGVLQLLWDAGSEHACVVDVWRWVVLRGVPVDTSQHLQFELPLFRPFSGNFYNFWQALMGADTLPPKIQVLLVSI